MVIINDHNMITLEKKVRNIEQREHHNCYEIYEEKKT